MKRYFKLIILFSLIFFSLSSIFATEVKKGISTGGMVLMETGNSGGAGEFGFPIYRGKNFYVRNHILFSGYGFIGGGGAMVLTDKILFGGFASKDKHPYGFIEGGVGIYRVGAKEFFQMPLYVDLKGGGGIDIYAGDKMSFFVEVGGGVNIKGSEINGMAHLGVGFRTFWN